MGATFDSDPRRGAAAPVRLHGLHRDGPGAGGREATACAPSPQLPRPLRHQGGLGLPVLTGDRGRGRAHRRDHRPAGARQSSATWTTRTSNCPSESSVNTAMLEKPLPPEEAEQVAAGQGTNISSLPDFEPLPDRIEAPVALKVGDDVSTDEILPAGARVLPYRSNIPKLAEFTFTQVDPRPTPPGRANRRRRRPHRGRRRQLRAGILAGTRRDRPPLSSGCAP